MEKHKHDHKMTKAIKGCIFGALMFAPLFAVLSTTLYATFNENAYLSYEHVTEEQYIKFDDNTDFPYYDVYFNFNNNQPTLINRYNIYVDNIKVISKGGLTTSELSLLEDSNWIRLWYDSNLNSNYFTSDKLTTNLSASGSPFTITCDIIGVSNTSNLSIYNNTFYSSVSNRTLDNAFTYSINELENNDLFNWSKDSELYTGIKTMTDGIGATNEIIPMLLTYWFILSVIYVIIDIIIECFTTLTHLLNYKTK